ncbi:hypothetical protein HYS31_01340 [Candidatus Woesearchaeota archaeon]|nr:hypothetical protein [Candidatus Woesearchaeota archaeon]
MGEINEICIENKNKSRQICSFKSVTLSILILVIALALSANAATVRVQSGALNVSNNLLVNTNTLFVDSANNRVGVGIINPSSQLEVKTSSGPGLRAYASGVSISYQSAYQHQIISDTVGSQTKGTLIWHRESDASRPSLEVAYGSGPTIMATFVNGNLGIGTPVPPATLSIVGSMLINHSSNGMFILDNSNVDADGVGVSMLARIRSNSLGGWQIARRGGTADSNADYDFFAGGDITTPKMTIGGDGNLGIATTSPNQRLMVLGNANITGTVYYGALQANSPVLERTAEPFVARCTIADDGKLVVEYIHYENNAYARVIEAVNSDSISWWHRSCFEKNERFKFLDSLQNNSITIENIGFDWNTKTAFLK